MLKNRRRLSLSLASGNRSGFTLIELLVVIAIIAILAALIIPAVIAAMAEANETSDFSTVKGFSNAFTMYHKKYQYFPTAFNMADSATITGIVAARTQAVRGAANLKVLLTVGIVEDVKAFFSPRDAAPDTATTDAIMAVLNDYAVTAFATSYAYDPGHNVNHGATVFFGTRAAWLSQNPGKPAHVLTAEMTGKKIEPNGASLFMIKNRAANAMTSTDDNIFVDNSTSGTPALGWRDSLLDSGGVPLTLAGGTTSP